MVIVNDAIAHWDERGSNGTVWAISIIATFASLLIVFGIAVCCLHRLRELRARLNVASSGRPPTQEKKKKSARAPRTRRARRMLRKGAVRIGDDGHDMDEDGYDVDVDDAAEMVQEAGLTGGQDDEDEEEEASAQLEEAQQQQPPARPRAVMVANLDYELD